MYLKIIIYISGAYLNELRSCNKLYLKQFLKMLK